MNKKQFYMLVWGINLIILLLMAYFYYQKENEKIQAKTLTEKSVFANISWPVGTMFEVDNKGDLTLIIQDSLEAFGGKWQKAARFKLTGNELEKIDTHTGFEYAQIKFRTQALLEFKMDKDYREVFIRFKDTIEIDGINIEPECRIFFRDLILNSLICPNMEEVYFKRRIELPEVKTFHNL